MVSPLWKACSDGDLQKAQEFLVEGSAVDIELKDPSGVTPLIEAARNGHIELVKILLDKGADPDNTSNHGRADEYTSDPAILELLNIARAKAAQNPPPPHQAVYAQPDQGQIDNGFYPPPPEPYPYYPSINPALSTVNEGGAYYPPQPPNGDTSPNGLGNLPPPDVARLIPCRYFPACRYGAQCMFAHPQPQPWGQTLLPPHAYGPYDPMANAYMPPYYPSQPAFAPPPPGPHPMSPPPSGAPMMHARSPSDVMSPPPAGHFSPGGAPPPPPPPPGSYGPMSPHGYPGQGHMGMPPIPPLAPLPPLHPHAHPGPPHPHANVYNQATSPVPPFPIHQDAPGPYPMPPTPVGMPYPETANGPKPEHPQAENYAGHPNHRDGNNQYRRGAPRRASFSARKPPCLFFPAGRCKNGDDCRFPHVLPENGAPAPHPPFPTVRPGPPRPRGHMNGNHAHVNGNGFQNIDAKLGNMSIRDDQTQQQSSRAKNGTEPSSRSHSSDNGTRPKFHGVKHHPNGGPNGHHKKAPAPFRHQQRVPNADEFPVLAGSITPPIRTPSMNGSVLTAAQVLQAAVPKKDGSKESSTRNTTPDPIRPAAPVVSEVKAESNGSAEAQAAPVPAPAPAPATEQTAPVVATPKPALSFAAAAANSNSTPDTSKEVSVSA